MLGPSSPEIFSRCLIRHGDFLELQYYRKGCLHLVLLSLIFNTFTIITFIVLIGPTIYITINISITLLFSQFLSLSYYCITLPILFL